MLATYMRRMRINNLESRIVGSSCRRQLKGLIKSPSRVLVISDLTI